MKKRIIQAIAVGLLLPGLMFHTAGAKQQSIESADLEPILVAPKKIERHIDVPLQCGFTPDMFKNIPTPPETIEETPMMSEEDIELISLITVAEAEGESEKGKRLVISTILNRLDSRYFPDTVSDVIYQKNQFSSVWNGRVNKCNVTDDIRELVKDELISRSDNDVMFFTAGQYGRYGKPMFREGNHYFSSYN